MCVPAAIVGCYYCGLAGCAYGAAKSLYTGSTFATCKALAANNTQVITERMTTHACVSNSINMGYNGGLLGIASGSLSGLIYGICSTEYQSKTNQRLPDIEMKLSPLPRIQVIDRTWFEMNAAPGFQHWTLLWLKSLPGLSCAGHGAGVSTLVARFGCHSCVLNRLLVKNSLQKPWRLRMGASHAPCWERSTPLTTEYALASLSIRNPLRIRSVWTSLSVQNRRKIRCQEK